MADDVLDNNPNIRRDALAALHEAAAGWALVQSDFDRARAEDLMQDAYVLVLEGRARFDGRAQLRTWLFGVIRRLAQNRQRRRRNRLRLLTRLADEAAHDVAPDHGGADDARRRQTLHAAMDRLPARQRDVLALVVYAEFSLAETADVLGLTLGSVRTHYHRAKVSLRQRLAEQPGEDHD